MHDAWPELQEFIFEYPGDAIALVAVTEVRPIGFGQKNGNVLEQPRGQVSHGDIPGRLTGELPAQGACACGRINDRAADWERG